MESNKYLDDITEIKNIMNRSSRFISLSGLSGVLAGIYALIGAFLAHQVLTEYPREQNRTVGYEWADFAFVEKLSLIAFGVMACAVVTGIVLTFRKSKKGGEKIWDVSSKRLVVNFLIPLIAGGLFCLALVQYRVAWLVAPATLIFYGLACVNASKYTLGDVRYMGIAFIILGLISTQFLGYGLYFWALGFGVCHIVYGALMHFKYDRK